MPFKNFSLFIMLNIFIPTYIRENMQYLPFCVWFVLMTPFSIHFLLWYFPHQRRERRNCARCRVWGPKELRNRFWSNHIIIVARVVVQQIKLLFAMPHLILEGCLIPSCSTSDVVSCCYTWESNKQQQQQKLPKELGPGHPHERHGWSSKSWPQPG